METKIEISDDTKRELIIRVLLSNTIIEAKENKKETTTVDLDQIINRVGQIEEMIFDDDFIDGIREVLEGE